MGYGDGQERMQLQGYCNTPIAKPEADEFESKTIREIREQAKQLGRDASQLAEVRATLIVNCREGRELAKFGCTYDQSKCVLVNLVSIFEKLIAAAQPGGREDGT